MTDLQKVQVHLPTGYTQTGTIHMTVERAGITYVVLEIQDLEQAHFYALESAQCIEETNCTIDAKPYQLKGTHNSPFYAQEAIEHLMKSHQELQTFYEKLRALCGPSGTWTGNLTNLRKAMDDTILNMSRQLHLLETKGLLTETGDYYETTITLARAEKENTL